MSGINPRSVFFMAVPIGNSDGTIDAPDADGVVSHIDETEVINKASSDVEDNGGVMIVYRCVPVRRISAYRVKIEPIEVDDVSQNAHRVMTEATQDQ